MRVSSIGVPGSFLLAVEALIAAASATAQSYPSYPWPQQSGQTAPPSAQQGQGTQGTQQPAAIPSLQPGMPPLSPWDPRSVRAATLDEVPGQPRFDPSNLFPTWVRPEAFQGFPVFPPSLGNYGAYPTGPGGGMQLPLGASQLPPPAPPATPDWPAWIQSRRPVSLPYEPNVAVVVRQADRVWWRSGIDEPFVPLYHHDNARALTAGAELQVRNTGEFLLMLHGGTRISSFGTASVRLDQLSDTAAVFALTEFTWAQLHAASRGFECSLPDGSRLVCDPPLDPQAAGPGIGDAGVRIERVIEPGRYSGRATIFNFGDRMVRWVTPLAEIKLMPGYRVTMLLAPTGGGALPGSLTEDRAAALADGEKRVWQAEEDGSVAWSGAQFRMPRGARLVIDPLLGDPFGRRSVVVPAGAAPLR